ncbi:MAG: hypothetical protein ACOYM2_15685, partial [Rectinemataceae bacterium]
MVAISGITTELFQELAKLVDIIASDTSVKSVILFGSSATGKRTVTIQVPAAKEIVFRGWTL